MDRQKMLRFIDLSDPQEPRLRDSGVPIDALVAYFKRVAHEDATEVARDYQLSVEDVEAALDYYRRYPAVIDARITLNAI